MKTMSDNDIAAVLKNGLEGDVGKNFWREFLKDAGRKRLKEFNINQYFKKDDVIAIASKLSPVLNNEDYSPLFNFGVRLFFEWRPWIERENQDEKFDQIVELNIIAQENNKKAP